MNTINPYTFDEIISQFPDTPKLPLITRTVTTVLPGDTVDIDSVKEATDCLDPDLGYTDWLNIGMALHSTAHPDAFDIWNEWSSKGKKYKASEMKAKWTSFSQTANGISIATLFHYAKQAGYTPSTNPQTKDYADTLTKLLGSVAYVTEHDSFYDLESGSMIKPVAFTRKHAHEIPKAATTMLADERCIKVDNLVYLPGDEEKIVEYENKSCLNIWHPSNAAYISCVSDANVKPYLELAQHIIPDNAELNHFLDLLAYAIQNPRVKINQAILLSGNPRIGKDSLLQPLIYALGQHNVKQPQAGELKEKFTDVYLNAKVVIYEEIQNFDKTEIENKLKPIIATPPNDLRLRLFNKGFVEIPNLVFCIFMSNHRNAIKISEGDGRYFCVWSSAQPLPEKTYVDFYDWLECDGNSLVYSWLMDRDVTGFNPKAPAPMTDYKREVIGLGRTDLEHRVEEMIKDIYQTFPNGDLVTYNDLVVQLGYNDSDHSPPSDKSIRAALANAGLIGKSVRTGKPRKRVLLYAIDNVSGYQKFTESQWREQWEKQNKT